MLQYFRPGPRSLNSEISLLKLLIVPLAKRANELQLELPIPWFSFQNHINSDADHLMSFWSMVIFIKLRPLLSPSCATNKCTWKCFTIKSPLSSPLAAHMCSTITAYPPPPFPPLAQPRCLFWTKQNTDTRSPLTRRGLELIQWSFRVTWHLVNRLLILNFPAITLR